MKISFKLHQIRSILLFENFKFFDFVVGMRKALGDKSDKK